MTYDVDSKSRSVPLNVKHVEQREGNSSKNYFCVRNLDILVYLFHSSSVFTQNYIFHIAIITNIRKKSMFIAIF